LSEPLLQEACNLYGFSDEPALERLAKDYDYRHLFDLNPIRKEAIIRIAEQAVILPDGNPHDWTEAEIQAAVDSFRGLCLAGGAYQDFFDGQPAVTRDEFMRAVLEDYDGNSWRIYWAWSTDAPRIECNRVRDHILRHRSRDGIGEKSH
ncbi:MAG: hypothetical protein ABSG53_04330, partial [Thermoguttaceae bacterium]